MSGDQRLNIALLPAWFPSEAMPMNGIFVRDQALAVAQRHDVAVIADDGRTARRPFELREATDHGLRVLRLAYRGSRVPPVVAAEYVAGTVAALRRLTREGRRPDVLHAHEYHAGVAALIAGRARGIPVVISEHSSHFAGGTLSRTAVLRARLAFGAADAVCPVSDYLRRAIEAHGVRAPMRVVPNPIDDRLFRPDAAAPRRDAHGRARVLVVAGLQPVKGVTTLLRAVGAVAGRRDDFRLDVIGDGPERAECERLIAELDLASRVTLHGYRPKDEIARRLAEASFAVQPSVTETFGVSVAEALAAGRPVLAARVGGLPELIDESSGMLVDAPTEPALAHGLEEMLDRWESFDPARVAERTRARCSRTAVAATWDDVYRSVLRRSRRGGGPESAAAAR